jgi:PIN domain nuclease of toxin-antitoxin system
VILLDTHVLVWLATEPTKLSKLARSAIRRASRAGGIGISAITLWELAWLATHGRLQLTGTVEAYLEEISSRVAVLPITTKVAALANQFRQRPFNRSDGAGTRHDPSHQRRENSRLQAASDALVMSYSNRLQGVRDWRTFLLHDIAATSPHFIGSRRPQV